MASIIGVVMTELERIPRGARGCAQNEYRAAFTAARLNNLGCRPHITPTAEAAHALALRCVRVGHPEWVDFSPTAR